jgi:hypothetical protein
MAFRVSSALGRMKIGVMCMGMIHGSYSKFIRKKKTRMENILALTRLRKIVANHIQVSNFLK